MFFETILETEDASYFVDRLVEITGKQREWWAGLSLITLRKYLEREIKKNRSNRTWY